MKLRKNFRAYSQKYGKGQGYIETTFRQLDYSQLLPWVVLRKGGPLEIFGWIAIFCIIFGLFIPFLRILVWIGLIMVLMAIIYGAIYVLLRLHMGG